MSKDLTGFELEKLAQAAELAKANALNEPPPLKKVQYHTVEFKQFVKKYDLIFSPRTTLSKQRESDQMITNQLIKHFDPFTVNFLKRDFDSRSGKATKPQFISCLKNHLLQWQPSAENREQKLIKYLSIIYDEIDLLDQKVISWEDFSNYLISKASSIGGLMGGSKGASGGKAAQSITASSGGGDEGDGGSMSQTIGAVEKIKSFSLAMSVSIPPRDKDKHKMQGSKSSMVPNTKTTSQESQSTQASTVTNQNGKSQMNAKQGELEKTEQSIKPPNGQSESKQTAEKTQKKANQASQNNNQRDEGKGTALHKAVFIPELDKIAIVEERSDTIQFLNARNGERGCKDLDCGVDAAKLATGGKGAGFNYSQFKKKIIVMSLLYLRLEDFNNLLLVATDDSLIRAWYYNGNQFVPVNPIINDEAHEGDIKILKAKQPQYCMAWDDVHQMLYSGQRDGMINVWNLRSSKPVGFLGTSTDIQSIMQQNKQAQQHQLQLQGKNVKKDNLSALTRSPVNHLSEQTPINIGDNLFGGGLHQNLNKDNFGHKDIVTELLMLPKLQYLASCSLDKKVILWDTITGEQKRVYTEHTMGVVSMTFNSEHILLFSAGFDHDIYVWNPYIDNPVFKVQAHNAPIVCVFAIDHTPQLISSDADGLVKVWDIRTFECVQTINVQENFEQFKFNLSYMLPIWQHKRLLIAGRQLLFFEYDKNQNPSLADDQAPLCCEYISKTQEFFTPVLDSVKCWNALNGSIKHIFKNDIIPATSPSSEITAFCLDLTQKRFIIGDSRGQIRMFNALTGELMKSLTEHSDGEILNLMAVKTKEMSMIVSVGSNGVIQLHEDDRLGGGAPAAVRRTIQIPNYEIQVARVYVYNNKTNSILKTDDEIKLGEDKLVDNQGVNEGASNEKNNSNLMKYMIVGLNKGSIKTYELETGRPDASYPAYKDSCDINEIYPLQSKPFFFTSDNVGLVTLWIGPPCINKYQKVFEMQNLDSEKNEPCAVNCIVYDESEDILFTGDERGTICAYNFYDLISQVQVRDPQNRMIQYTNQVIESKKKEQNHQNEQERITGKKGNHQEGLSINSQRANDIIDRMTAMNGSSPQKAPSNNTSAIIAANSLNNSTLIVPGTAGSQISQHQVLSAQKKNYQNQSSMIVSIDEGLHQPYMQSPANFVGATSVSKRHQSTLNEFNFNMTITQGPSGLVSFGNMGTFSSSNQMPSLKWRSKEHSESIRHLKFLQIYDKKLLISTSYDRKVKIWDSETGEHIDSLRKGNSDESYPIGFKEKQVASSNNLKLNSGNTGLGLTQSKTGSKKIMGMDMESLKRKVEQNPALDKIKETISENTRSTEWKLHLNVDQITQEQQEYIESIGKLMAESKLNHPNRASQYDSNSTQRFGAASGLGGTSSIKNQQLEIEMLGKVFNIYQQKANELVYKSSNMISNSQMAMNTMTQSQANLFQNQNMGVITGTMANPATGGDGRSGLGSVTASQRSMINSSSQPALLNLKIGTPAQNNFLSSMKSNQSLFGIMASAQNLPNMPMNFPPTSQLQLTQALQGGGLSIVSQVKAELSKVEESIVPRRKRFVEQKESLATQKLLYPSKFRKDPYRSKLVNQQKMMEQQMQQTQSFGGTNSGGINSLQFSNTLGEGTKLPNIMKSKVNSSGQMLMSMMGLKEKNRMPRNVSEAAIRFISALDKAETDL